ncbi:hypothetical protein D3C78_1312700 [compost metagenome]
MGFQFRRRILAKMFMHYLWCSRFPRSWSRSRTLTVLNANQGYELLRRQSYLKLFHTKKIADPLEIKRCRNTFPTKVLIELPTINTNFPTNLRDRSVVTTQQPQIRRQKLTHTMTQHK